MYNNPFGDLCPNHSSMAVANLVLFRVCLLFCTLCAVGTVGIGIRELWISDHFVLAWLRTIIGGGISCCVAVNLHTRTRRTDQTKHPYRKQVLATTGCVCFLYSCGVLLYTVGTATWNFLIASNPWVVYSKYALFTVASLLLAKRLYSYPPLWMKRSAQRVRSSVEQLRSFLRL